MIWQWLSEPHVSIKDREVRRRVRLLSSLLLVLIPLDLLGAAVAMPRDAVAGSLLSGTVMLLAAAYCLSRTRYHRLAAAITVGAYSAVPFASLMLRGGDQTHHVNGLIWLVLPVVFGNMVLPTRGLVVMTVLNEAALIGLAVFMPGIRFNDIIFPMSFVGVTSALLVVMVFHRAWLERDRLAELTESNRELQSLRGSLERRIQERTVELGEAQNFLQSIIDNLPAILFAKDAETLRYVYWNRAGESLLGVEKEKMLGRIDSEIFPPELAERFAGEDRAIVSGGKVLDIAEEMVEARHRQTRFLHTRKTLIPGADGKPKYLLGISEDITERKEAEEKLRHQNEYLAALHETTLGLLGRLDVSDLLEAIVRRAMQLSDAQHGYIYLLESDGDGPEMEMKFAVGASRPEIGNRIKLGQGVSGRVWEIVEPLVVNDYDQWEGRLPGIKYGIYRSIMAAPLISGSSVAGVIGLAHDRSTDRVFDGESVGLLSRFAQLASIALDNARLLETERLARRQAETLQAATQALSTTLDLKEVLETILIRLKEVVPYDSASVQELDGDRLKIIGGVGFEKMDEVQEISFDIRSTDIPNRQVIMSRQTLVLDDFGLNRYAGFQQGSRAVIHSWIGVPLLFGDRVIGMITLDNREPGFYTAVHAQLAQVFAAQAAVAIENARLYSAVQTHAAENEALYRASTHLLNPGADLEAVAAEIAWAVTREFSLANCSVLVMDESRAALRRVANVGDYQVTGALALPLDGPGITVSAARSGEMVYAPDVTADPRYLAKDSRTRSELAVPLKAGEHVTGVLDLQSPTPNAFDDRARRIITAFAKHAELALENARLVAHLAQAYKTLQEEQQKLLTAEKMASLGRLTAGIAHEMNTPLAAVRSGLTEVSHLIEEYRAALGDPEITFDDHREIADDMRKTVRLAEAAAERAASFVRSIKSQTRDMGPRERQRFNAVPVIQDTLLLLGHALRHAKCAAAFEHEADTLELLGAPGRLAQVVTNLVTNAIDASAAKDGGPITLRLVRVPAGLDLQVTDSGAGIPPELVGKIFDPMFTTKPFGQGTGLGLTIIRDIVTGEFGGQIDVASQPGHGATFTIHFPKPQEN